MINHASDEIFPAITSSAQQTSIITVTTTVSSTAVITPQSFCSCSGQQQTSASSSSSDSDIVTIVTPVVVVLVVIILILLIVIGVLWRKAKHQSDIPYDKAVPKTKVLVENDLYGLVVVASIVLVFLQFQFWNYSSISSSSSGTIELLFNRLFLRQCLSMYIANLLAS